MALDHLSLENISEQDLLAIVEAGVPEGLRIDFKRDTYGGSDGDRKEFLADISSFANTSGGDLIIGMDESDRIANELVGVSLPNADSECLRLEGMARDSLQPRIPGLRVVPIGLENGKHALVVRIPKSWNSPHRIIFKKSNRFWARTDGGKYEPDIDQLRQLFRVGPALAEQVQKLSHGPACQDFGR